MGSGQAILPIAVILNVAEHSPKRGSGLLIGNETGVLVEHLLWCQISRTAHLSEGIDIEGFDREKDGVPDQSIQTYAMCGINQSPDVARFSRGLPFRFHVVGPNEAIVSLIHQEIGPAKHTLNTSHPQYLNVLCIWIKLWLDPRYGVTRQGKRAVVVVERKRHAATGPKQVWRRCDGSRQFDLLLPETQAPSWRKTCPLCDGPQVHHELRLGCLLFHCLLHVTTKREQVFRGTAAFRVSARVSRKENENIGTPQGRDGLPQMSESLL